MVKNITLCVRRPSRPKAQAIDRAPISGDERYRLERSVLAKTRHTPRFLLHELFDFFQGRADCFPSNARISEVSGMSVRTIQYGLRELERAELVKSIEDLSIASQRRLVLLDHPHALATLKTLGALPEWLARWVRPGGAAVAPPERLGDATVARGGMQDGDAAVAPESGIQKQGTRNRVYPALRGMGS